MLGPLGQPRNLLQVFNFLRVTWVLCFPSRQASSSHPSTFMHTFMCARMCVHKHS